MIKIFDRHFRFKCKNLHLTCDIDMNTDRLKEWNPYTCDDRLPIENAVCIVSSIFGDILQLSDLAFPGVIDTYTGVSIVDNKAIKYINEKRSIFPFSLSNNHWQR